MDIRGKRYLPPRLRLNLFVLQCSGDDKEQQPLCHSIAPRNASSCLRPGFWAEKSFVRTGLGRKAMGVNKREALFSKGGSQKEFAPDESANRFGERSPGSAPFTAVVCKSNLQSPRERYGTEQGLETEPFSFKRVVGL